MSKHLELAKKLKALSEKGFGGEKVTAEKMLNNLLKKHNLTFDEIEENDKKDFFFKIINKLEFKILYQIVKQVNYYIDCYGEIPKSKITKYKLKGNYLITCTVSEYLEIEAKFLFFKDLYNKELILFTRAFIHANDLGVDDPKGDIEKPQKEENFEESLRIYGLASNIKKGEFYKQLNEKPC